MDIVLSKNGVKEDFWFTHDNVVDQKILFSIMYIKKITFSLINKKKKNYWKNVVLFMEVKIFY